MTQSRPSDDTGDQTVTSPDTSLGRAVQLFTWRVALLLVLASLAVTWLSTPLDGESVFFSNVVYEIGILGQFRYPLHAQSLALDGIEAFMVHPPLQYLLAAAPVRLWGYGVWQLLLPSLLIAAAIVLGVSTVMKRVYGVPAAIAVAVLIGSSPWFYKTAFVVRPDLLLGFLTGALLLATGFAWLPHKPARKAAAVSGLVGMLGGACCIAHWNGIWGAAYAAAHPFMMRRRHARLRTTLPATAVGFALPILLWAALAGRDFLPGLRVALTSTAPSRLEGSAREWRSITRLTDVWTHAENAHVLEFAFAFGLVALVLSAYRTLRDSRSDTTQPQEKFRRVDIFLLGNVLCFAAFLFITRRNLDPAYVANHSVLLFAVSARGIAFLVTGLKNLARSPAWSQAACSVALLIGLSASPYFRTTLTTRVEKLYWPDRCLRSIRTLLNPLVPANARLVVGSNSYLYVYDRNPESQYHLFFRQMMQGATTHARFDPTKPLWPQWEHDFQFSLTAPEYREALERSATAGIFENSQYVWQWRFLTPAIWQPTFRHAATVFVADWPPQFLFLRRNAPPDPESSPLRAAPHITHREGAWLVEFGTAPAPESFAMTLGTWRSMRPPARRRAVVRFLDDAQWFGLETTRSAEATRLVTLVEEKWWEDATAVNPWTGDRTLTEAFTWEQAPELERTVLALLP